MFYAGVVACTTVCQIIFTYPGVISFDECLTVLSKYNKKITKLQIAPKLTGKSFFYNFGCFEIKKTIDKDGVEAAVFKKFGQASYIPDKNIKRILKRRYYDYPQNPNFVMRKRR